MAESPLNAALRHFEATEANLSKMERLLTVMEAAIPRGIEFCTDVAYDENCRCFEELLKSLPQIDQWKPTISVMTLRDVAQCRLDALELGEPGCIADVEDAIAAPRRALQEYRSRFNQKRRELVRDALSNAIEAVDSLMVDLSKLTQTAFEMLDPAEPAEFAELRKWFSQIKMLLGSSISKPLRWSDLERHLSFGTWVDLHDILTLDWPRVRAGLRQSLFGENEPIPVVVNDLGELVSAKPRGPVATRLLWDRLTAEGFERLVFALISSEDGYENPQWLTRTEAGDRGRDLSVTRVLTDSLSGTMRHRVIIQCKHWLTRSIGVGEVATLKEQMRLWEPPRVDVHIIATTGRFTSDAISFIEKHNQSEAALRIDMWPESHLERLLASRPALIGEFSLR